MMVKSMQLNIVRGSVYGWSSPLWNCLRNIRMLQLELKVSTPSLHRTFIVSIVRATSWDSSDIEGRMDGSWTSCIQMIYGSHWLRMFKCGERSSKRGASSLGMHMCGYREDFRWWISKGNRERYGPREWRPTGENSRVSSYPEVTTLGKHV